MVSKSFIGNRICGTTAARAELDKVVEFTRFGAFIFGGFVDEGFRVTRGGDGTIKKGETLYSFAEVGDEVAETC